MLGIAPGSPSRKSAIQNQVTDPLRVADGIDDRDRTSLRNSEQRKAIKSFQLFSDKPRLIIVNTPVREQVRIRRHDRR